MMSKLIKELGGYEKAKDGLHRLKFEKKDLLTCGDLVVVKSEIDAALIEYRRQHNIFEVGDRVIYNESDFLYKVNTVNSSGFHATTVHEVVRHIIAIFGHDNVRHATDLEIQAGCRL